MQELADSLVERRWIDAGHDGLAGKRIEIAGLQFTITDALVRFEMLDGRNWTVIARPSRPWVEMAAEQTWLETAGAYVMEGVRHILYGPDHLLFVLGLMLIVKGRWMLLKTVTAFTVAHSITLAMATFGYAKVPAAPLNAAIALSILFLGPEIVRAWRGETSFTLRHPWVVAFAFGLLHGFGFASALTGAGLPRQDLPLALVSFNVGVELGQLGFIAVVLAALRTFSVLQIRWKPWVRFLPATSSARSVRSGRWSASRCWSGCCAEAARRVPQRGWSRPVYFAAAGRGRSRRATARCGVEYYYCGGNFYRAAFEGNSLVYVTTKP